MNAARMCTCMMHCPESEHHERACCGRTRCECRCHERRAASENFVRRVLTDVYGQSAPDDVVAATAGRVLGAVRLPLTPNG